VIGGVVGEPLELGHGVLCARHARGLRDRSRRVNPLGVGLAVLALDRPPRAVILALACGDC
jgi:hypothetical protein